MRLYEVSIKGRKYVATGFKKSTPFAQKNSKSNKEPRSEYQIYLQNGEIINTNDKFTYKSFVVQPKKKKK